MEISQDVPDVPVHSIHQMNTCLRMPSAINATVSGLIAKAYRKKQRPSRQIWEQEEQRATNVVKHDSEVDDADVSDDVCSMCRVSSGNGGIHPMVVSSDVDR